MCPITLEVYELQKKFLQQGIVDVPFLLAENFIDACGLLAPKIVASQVVRNHISRGPLVSPEVF